MKGFKEYCSGFVEGFERADKSYKEYKKQSNLKTADEAVEDIFERVDEYDEYFKHGFIEGVRLFTTLILNKRC